MPVYRVAPVDIERSAHGMVRFYGASAELVAMECARKYERAKDDQARETWTAIVCAIRQAKNSSSGENPAE